MNDGANKQSSRHPAVHPRRGRMLPGWSATLVLTVSMFVMPATTGERAIVTAALVFVTMLFFVRPASVPTTNKESDDLERMILQLDTVNRSHDETAELALKVFELSQTLRQQ